MESQATSSLEAASANCCVVAGVTVTACTLLLQLPAGLCCLRGPGRVVATPTAHAAPRGSRSPAAASVWVQPRWMTMAGRRWLVPPVQGLLLCILALHIHLQDSLAPAEHDTVANGTMVAAKKALWVAATTKNTSVVTTAVKNTTKDAVLVATKNARAMVTKNAVVVATTKNASEVASKNASVVTTAVKNTTKGAAVVATTKDATVVATTKDATVVATTKNARAVATKNARAVATTKDAVLVATKNAAVVAATKNAAVVAATKNAAVVAATKNARAVATKNAAVVVTTKDAVLVATKNASEVATKNALVVATASNTSVASTGNASVATNTSVNGAQETMLTCQSFQCSGERCYQDEAHSNRTVTCHNETYCELYRFSSTNYTAGCSSRCGVGLCRTNGSESRQQCALECCATPLCLQLNASTYGDLPPTTAPPRTTNTTHRPPPQNGKVCTAFSCHGDGCFKGRKTVARCILGQDFCEMKRTGLNYMAGCSKACKAAKPVCASGMKAACYQECCPATPKASCLKLDGKIHG
ncbi:uncharacterized protein LOC127462377 isoform X2 [Manacus candei]|uniref:uncharacterized protein LOC127462377 isoform X2 n=1 Tax=Manacus candei TaxID=415023 RepID=UPI002227D5A7|nr:uncharacterized protein LOC127462377 isoform X2 [Manacus candei]